MQTVFSTSTAAIPSLEVTSTTLAAEAGPPARGPGLQQRIPALQQRIPALQQRIPALQQRILELQQRIPVFFQRATSWQPALLYPQRFLNTQHLQQLLQRQGASLLRLFACLPSLTVSLSIACLPSLAGSSSIACLPSLAGSLPVTFANAPQSTPPSCQAAALYSRCRRPPFHG